MTNNVLTGRQMLDWVEDVKKIEKLINRKSFMGLLKQSDSCWQDFWCGPAMCPVLGVNNGYYKGFEAIAGYYEARHRRTVLCTSLLREAYPGEFEQYSADEMLGAGSMVMDNLSTQIIEVAGDGKTAKGLWYVVTTDIDLMPHGPEARWMWGRIGIDFIKESDVWKIWHMLYVEDINERMGADWTKKQPEYPAKEEFSVLESSELPAPNVPADVHERYYKERPVNPIPMVPQPYYTFSDTFSYTI